MEKLHTPSTFNLQPKKGFTLIEMMVAVAIFAIVMMIGVGALLSLIQTNKRAQAINSVMNNLNAAIETMSRTIRVGTTYHCRTSTAVPGQGQLAVPQDCAAGGGLLFAFEPSSGTGSVDDQVVYRIMGTTLQRSLTSGRPASSWVDLTAPEVSVDSFEVFVVGSVAGDGIQPRALMKIKGSALVPGGVTNFTVQASVVQRLIDI